MSLSDTGHSSSLPGPCGLGYSWHEYPRGSQFVRPPAYPCAPPAPHGPSPRRHEKALHPAREVRKPSRRREGFSAGCSPLARGPAPTRGLHKMETLMLTPRARAGASPLFVGAGKKGRGRPFHCQPSKAPPPSRGHVPRVPLDPPAHSHAHSAYQSCRVATAARTHKVSTCAGPLFGDANEKGPCPPLPCARCARDGCPLCSPCLGAAWPQPAPS